MLSERPVEEFVLARFVGHDMRLVLDILFQDRRQIGSLERVHDHAPGAPGVAIHQRENLVLVVEAPALLVAARLDRAVVADEGFVNLDDPAIATEGGEIARAHGLADAVGEKPCGLVSHLQHPVELVSRDTLLRAGHEVDGLERLIERQAGMFKDGANLDGELLFAVATAPEAEPDALGRVGRYLSDPIHAAAMRARSAIGPNDPLKMLESLGFIVKFGTGKGGHCVAADVLFS